MRKIVISLFATCMVWGGSAAADPQADPQTDPSAAPKPVPSTSTPAATAPPPAVPAVDPTATTTTGTATGTAEASTTQTTSADTTGVPPEPTRVGDVPAPESRSWVNRPLLVTSAILLVGSYVPMAAVAYTSDRPADQTNLYYPVVGPWMNLADRQCDIRACNNEGLNKAMLILDGVGQGLGALGVVTSFFLPNKATANWYLIGDEKTHAGPTRVGTGYGFGAAGHF